jgi:hypothetical protein
MVSAEDAVPAGNVTPSEDEVVSNVFDESLDRKATNNWLLKTASDGAPPMAMLA